MTICEKSFFNLMDNAHDPCEWGYGDVEGIEFDDIEIRSGRKKLAVVCAVPWFGVTHAFKNALSPAVKYFDLAIGESFDAF